jgi:hypothetical protein
MHNILHKLNNIKKKNFSKMKKLNVLVFKIIKKIKFLK